jgi:toxin ParE1/3/4
MKVVYTEEALADLAEIADYLAEHYPAVAPTVRNRLYAVIGHLARWPESARRARGRSGVRVMPLGKYPYRIFYRVAGDAIEILHIHHAARRPWAK